MPDFLVVWKIDIDADNHEEAACKALIVQRDMESSALYFEVTEHLTSAVGLVPSTVTVNLNKE